MEHEIAVRDRQIQRLMLWNRLWMVLFIALAVAGGGLWLIRQMLRTVTEVHSRWDGDTLRIHSMTGRVVITHLQGRSDNADTPIIAPLPTPLFTVDSEGIHLEYKMMQTLSWRDEGGSLHPAPKIGSPVYGLYYRAQPTIYDGKR